jgi:hypothetical protein
MGQDEKAMVAGPDCAMPAPGVSATLNGVALKRMLGPVAGDESVYFRDCIVELAFPGPRVKQGRARSVLPGAPADVEAQGPVPEAARIAGPSTLRIEQGATAEVLTIHEAFSPRTLTVVSPEDGVIRPRQAVTLRWHPVTDRIAHGQVALSLRPRGGKGLSPDELTIHTADLSFQGNDITFAVPSTLPETLRGDAEIQFLGSAWVQPGIGPCPVERCSVRLAFDAPLVPVRLERDEQAPAPSGAPMGKPGKAR